MWNPSFWGPKLWSPEYSPTFFSNTGKFRWQLNQFKQSGDISNEDEAAVTLFAELPYQTVKGKKGSQKTGGVNDTPKQQLIWYNKFYQVYPLLAFPVAGFILFILLCLSLERSKTL